YRQQAGCRRNSYNGPARSPKARHRNQESGRGNGPDFDNGHNCRGSADGYADSETKSNSREKDQIFRTA
ncbi:MAG TPA: hypothetical protein VKL99_07465, partial [Candidatus Angelobacter sp.]|nr:hypothetical protein [Candidatus Angelobacter sp.]